jgi:hypothetical protein
LIVAEYITKMKSLFDDMVSAGKKLDDEEFCSYIMAGLDYEYNSFFSSIVARVEPVTFGELYSQLLAFETRLDLQSQGSSGGHPFSSANTASRGYGGFSIGHGGCGARGGGNIGVRGRDDAAHKSKNKFPRASYAGEQITWYSSVTSGLA